MKTTFLAARLLSTAMWLCPSLAAAQIPGALDTPSRPGGAGPAFAVDAAYGLNQDSGESLYSGIRVGFPVSGAVAWLGGGYGGIAAGGDNVFAGGVGVAAGLGEAGSATWTLDAGFGASRRYGSMTWAAPVGVTAWFGGSGAVVRPFLGVHGTVAKVSFDTDVGFGSIGGIAFELPSGLGFYLGAQWDKIGEGEPLGLGTGMVIGSE